MSTWNEFCQSVKKTATRAADKIGQTVDVATLQVKLSSAESKLNDAYAVLGRLEYGRRMEQEISGEQIEKAIQAVQKQEELCAELKAQIAQAKASGEQA